MNTSIEIQNLIKKALKSLTLTEADFTVEHPADVSRGDYATNVALVLAKQAHANPRDLAVKILDEIEKVRPTLVEKVEVAGPGFINFFLSQDFFTSSLKTILKSGKDFGTNKIYKGQKVLVEYGNPNPFKEIHIGHMMSTIIGESVSRIIEASGAKVLRARYQGDVGIHIAKTVWGMMENQAQYPNKKTSIKDKVAFLGSCYSKGSVAYEENEEVKNVITAINKKIFDKSDKVINALYTEGREWSLESFEVVFKKLGVSKLDYRFFESEVADDGVRIVHEFLKKDIFEKSDNAIVFKAEKYDPKLHTRVFINSQGLPTYEAKELGLTEKKFKKAKPDLSIVITANEQNEYFKVVLKALSLIDENAFKKTKHFSHGMLRLTDGKMSSRKGNVISAESLVNDVETLVVEKIKDRNFDESLKADVAEAVAIGAIKYSILRQAIGGDIIYEFEKSLSFEGDSGPYLQYAHTRAQSLLEKARREKVKSGIKHIPQNQIHLVKILYRFPEVVEQAGREYAPHLIATYLIDIASLFNSFYANEQIVNKNDIDSPYKIAVTEAFAQVMRNGLNLLGIEVPEKM